MRPKPPQILPCALALAFLAPALRSVSEPSTNPYSGIIDRNVFGLKSIPPPQPTIESNRPAPARIILTGITMIFGDKRVLMKIPVPIGKPGEPPQPERFCILAEGQRDGDIDVLEVDADAGTVNVNNAGVVQLLSLAEHGVSLPGSAPPAPPPPPAVLAAAFRSPRSLR